MKKNLAKFGIAAGLGLAVLTGGSSGENFTRDRGHDVRYVRESDFMEGTARFLPTLNYEDNLGLSRLDRVGNTYRLLDANVPQTVTYEPLARYLAQRVVDSPAARGSAPELTVLVPRAEHGWNDFELRWDSNVIEGGKYSDVFVISSSDKSAGLIDADRDGIVNRVNLYERDVSGNFKLAESWNFDEMSGNEQTRISRDNTELLRFLEDNHSKCGDLYGCSRE